MNVSKAVAERRSIRAFLPRPVARAVIERVLEKARFAPSGGNLQPWRAVVVAGDPLRRLCDTVARRMAGGGATRDHSSYPEPLPEPFRRRRRDCAADLYAAAGIPWDDRERRDAQTARNFVAFDAPCVIFCHMPRYMGPPQWEDLGIWLQTVMLLFQEEGLGSCAQGSWGQAGAIVRDELGIPDDEVVCCGLAVGHADPDAPVNALRTSRAPLRETARFVGL